MFMNLELGNFIGSDKGLKILFFEIANDTKLSAYIHFMHEWVLLKTRISWQNLENAARKVMDICNDIRT